MGVHGNIYVCNTCELMSSIECRETLRDFIGLYSVSRIGFSRCTEKHTADCNPAVEVSP